MSLDSPYLLDVVDVRDKSFIPVWERRAHHVTLPNNWLKRIAIGSLVKLREVTSDIRQRGTGRYMIVRLTHIERLTSIVVWSIEHVHRDGHTCCQASDPEASWQGAE